MWYALLKDYALSDPTLQALVTLKLRLPIPREISLPTASTAARIGLHWRVGSARRGAFVGEFGEGGAECRHTLAQGVEILFLNDQNVKSGTGAHGGVAGLVGEQSHFSKILAAGQGCQEFLLAILFLEDLTLPFFNDIRAVAQIPLLKDEVPGLEVLILDGGFIRNLGLCQFRREQHVEQPIVGDPDLAIDARHL